MNKKLYTFQKLNKSGAFFAAISCVLLTSSLTSLTSYHFGQKYFGSKDKKLYGFIFTFDRKIGNFLHIDNFFFLETI